MEGRRGKRLEGLLALTDAALAQLGLNALVDALLDRTVELVAADTATVLLLDADGDHLVAWATRGVEEEVRLGVRVPMGAGFSGRIAQSKRALAVDRIDATTVVNPAIWEQYVKVLLGVPLLAGGDILGVLQVGRHEDEPFDDQDAALLGVAGERIAAAIQHELWRDMQAAATQLEQSLQPRHLPRCEGLDFAARYLPSERRRVGGDWYDLFVLPGGELWVVVGDVAGHGLPAAVVMGRLQSTVRAYAALGGPPEAVLEQTDRAVQLFDPDTMVTMVCAVMQPPYREVRLAGAGHPPPVLAPPNGPGTLLALPPGPPLGVVEGAHRQSTTVTLADGSTLLLYTDGLVERRTESLAVGLDRLRDTMVAGSADDTCRHVLRHLVGADELNDDVAMVAVHKLPVGTV